MAKQNWLPTDNRFIGFLDIMGFKDLVMRTDHDEIFSLLTKISSIRSHLETLPSEYDSEFQNAEVRSASFSDSIVLFSKSNSLKDFELFTSAIRWLFAKTMEMKIPIKGAIAYGQLSINQSKQIYFGQPLIDAYLLEEELNYYGVVLHNSCLKILRENNNSSIIAESYFECPTPLKSGLITHTNLEWFQDLKADDFENSHDILNDIIEHFKTTTSGGPAKYLDNTLKVFSEYENKNSI